MSIIRVAQELRDLGIGFDTIQFGTVLSVPYPGGEGTKWGEQLVYRLQVPDLEHTIAEGVDNCDLLLLWIRDKERGLP